MGLPGMLLSSLSSAFLALPICDTSFTGVACRLVTGGYAQCMGFLSRIAIGECTCCPRLCDRLVAQ